MHDDITIADAVNIAKVLKANSLLRPETSPTDNDRHAIHAWLNDLKAWFDIRRWKASSYERHSCHSVADRG